MDDQFVGRAQHDELVAAFHEVEPAFSDGLAESTTADHPLDVPGGASDNAAATDGPRREELSEPLLGHSGRGARRG